MPKNELEKLVCELCSVEGENEWLELKTIWFKPVELGEYISVLSNSAAYAGRKLLLKGWRRQ